MQARLQLLVECTWYLALLLYSNFNYPFDLRMYAVAGRSQCMHWFDRRSNHYDIDPQLKNSTHKSTIICILCYVNRADLKIYLSIPTDWSKSWNLLINLLIISITLLVSSSVGFDLNLKSHYNTHVLNNKTKDVIAIGKIYVKSNEKYVDVMYFKTRNGIEIIN